MTEKNREVKTITRYHDYLKRIQSGQKGLNPYLDYFKITMKDLGNGCACFQMPVRPEYLQGAGVIQVGLIVALADEAIAHAMMTQLNPEEDLTTIELKSNFLSSAAEGELFAEAHVFKKGRSLMIGDCIVKNETGKSVCRVSATFLLLKKKEDDKDNNR